MRRAGPILIVVIGLLALVVDFWPNLYLPALSAGGRGPQVETKLGLDLQGGLKVEYRVIPDGRQDADPGDVDVVKQIIERRVNATGVVRARRPDLGHATASSSRSRASATPRRSAASSARPAASTSCRSPCRLRDRRALPGRASRDRRPAAADRTEPPLFSRRPGRERERRHGSSRAGAVVAFTLRGQGAKLFGDYTTAHVGEFFAIVLDGRVDLGAVDQRADHRRLRADHRRRARRLPAAEAEELVNVLRFGSLPFPVRGAGERHDRPDARRGVPQAEPARRRDRASCS